MLDQLGRARAPETLVERLDGVTGVGVLPWTTSEAPRTVLMAAVCATVAVAAVASWRRGRARLWVALLVAEVLVLLASPSYFTHYAAYSAAAVPLVVASAVSLVPVGRRVWTAAVACVALGLVRARSWRDAAAVPRRPGAPRPARRRVTGRDSPGALALLDVLSRDEERGCDLPGRRLRPNVRRREPRRAGPAGRPGPQPALAALHRHVPDLRVRGRRHPRHRRRPRAGDEARLHDRMTVVSVGRVEVLLHGTPASRAPTRTPAPVTVRSASAAGH